ncbi:hypothetical protein, partial [Gottfriedia acidiceleris]|uniref:hypothetical protein n=1 Tax=Gottfriedia acidiceleris TaxID=371036 RepID=UPI002FFE5925
MHIYEEINIDHEIFEQKTESDLIAWNKNWIRKYESPWSLLQKILFANEIDQRQILILLGTEMLNSQNRLPNLSLKKGDLINQMYFDSVKLQKYYLVEPFDESRAFIELMSTKLGISAHHVFEHDVLRFCESCMENGYHSNFHQLRFLTKCPFHDSNLRNSCPMCDCQYSYNLRNPNMKFPYICKCGYRYIDFETIDKMFSLFELLLDVTESFKLEMNQITKDDFISRVVFTEEGEVQDLKTHVQRLLQLKQTGKSDVASEKLLAINHLFFINKTINKNHSDSNYYSVESYKDQKAIYKSIARYIRKNFMKMHKKCIRKLTISIDNIIKCHHANAYVSWRMFIEGVNGHHNVQNGQTTK